MFSTTTEVTTAKVVTSVTTLTDLPDELLRLISISAGPTEYCNFRRAMKRVWLYNTGREDHCIKHFLVTKVNSEAGGTITTLCGKPHSMFDIPTIILHSGRRVWYQHGKIHRDNDQPAVVDSDGTKLWFHHDKIHRDGDRPAVIYSDGQHEWRQHGNLHRDNDQPAWTHTDGRKHWHKHGVEYAP